MPSRLQTACALVPWTITPARPQGCWLPAASTTCTPRPQGSWWPAVSQECIPPFCFSEGHLLPRSFPSPTLIPWSHLRPSLLPRSLPPSSFLPRILLSHHLSSAFNTMVILELSSGLQILHSPGMQDHRQSHCPASAPLPDCPPGVVQSCCAPYVQGRAEISAPGSQGHQGGSLHFLPISW